jgi:hypothetical protein
MATADRSSNSRRAGGAVGQFLRAPVRIQTYKNLLYLALAFPLGLIYFVGIVVGLSLGTSLLITLVGVPLLVGTLLGATALAGVEAALATYLAGVETPLPAALRGFEPENRLALPDGDPVDVLEQFLTTPTTWTSLVVVAIKFGFGIASFVALVTVGSVTGAALLAPLLYDQSTIVLLAEEIVVAGEYTVGPWAVETLPEALAVAAGGVVLLFAGLNALNALAYAHARVTAALLRVGE